MTVITQTNRIEYESDGVTTTYRYDFPVLSASHLDVYDNAPDGSSTLILPSEYTVTGAGEPDGGNVILDAPIADGNTLAIYREVPIDQLLDYVPYGEFPAESHEGALDKLTMICQQLNALFDRVVLYPPGTNPPAGQFPPPEGRGGYNVEFSEDGETLVARYNTAREWAENPVNTPVFGTTNGLSSLHHSDRSRQWAERAEDVPIEGTTGNFSALHWARKAEQVDANLAMLWRGQWVDGTEYQQREVVRDGNWTMIANKTTTDRPAPQAVAQPLWVYQGASPTSQITAKSLILAQRYTLGVAATILKYRVWTVIGNDYTVFARDESSGAITTLISFTASAAGWQEFATSGNLFPVGTAFSVGVYISEPDPSPVTFTGRYNYSTPQNAIAPILGQVTHANSSPSLISVNKTDDDSVDQSASLGGLSIGDIIEGPNLRWSIQAIVDRGTYFDFTVAPQQQDVPDGLHTFIFETVSSTPITSILDPDHWLTQPNVDAWFSVDGGPETITQTAYGIDIEVQEYSASEDWDIVALSSDQGGGGSNFQPRGAVTDIQEFDGTYIVASSDAGKVFRSADPGVIPVVTLNQGILGENAVIHVMQGGSEAVTLAGDVTYVLNGIDAVTNGQWAVLTLTVMAGGVVHVMGNGVPV